MLVSDKIIKGCIWGWLCLGGMVGQAQVADLQVIKTVNDTTPSEGQGITYTVEAKNLGPSQATGIQLLDLLPSGVTLVSAVPDQGGYTASNGVWDVGVLDSGKAKKRLLDVTVDVGTSGTAVEVRPAVSAPVEAGTLLGSVSSRERPERRVRLELAKKRLAGPVVVNPQLVGRALGSNRDSEQTYS